MLPVRGDTTKTDGYLCCSDKSTWCVETRTGLFAFGDTQEYPVLWLNQQLNPVFIQVYARCFRIKVANFG